MTRVCVRCKRERKHKARGMCHSCYVVALRHGLASNYRRTYKETPRLGTLRMRRLNSRAKITRDQVFFLHREFYQARGMSCYEIAGLIWKQRGYSSRNNAEIALRQLFRSYVLPMREKKPPVCSGCGCPWDERTRGCSACIKRFWKRSKKAALPAEARRAA